MLKYTFHMKGELITINSCLKKSSSFVFKTCYYVHNNQLNLCGQVETSKWILCSQKTGVKCGYLRFLMYCTNTFA